MRFANLFGRERVADSRVFLRLEPGEEITVDIEHGKTMIVKFLTIGDAHPDGTRTLFFELNGQPREVNVRDSSLRVVERTHPKADAEIPATSARLQPV